MKIRQAILKIYFEGPGNGASDDGDCQPPRQWEISIDGKFASELSCPFVTHETVGQGFSTSNPRLNVRFWLLADSLPHPKLCPLYPRKRTF